MLRGEGGTGGRTLGGEVTASWLKGDTITRGDVQSENFYHVSPHLPVFSNQLCMYHRTVF